MPDALIITSITATKELFKEAKDFVKFEFDYLPSEQKTALIINFVKAAIRIVK